MKYFVLGLGISGKGAITLLEKNNIEYIAVDDKLAMKSKDAQNIISSNDIVVKSPGISWDNEFLIYCIKNNIKIISEIDLALDFIDKNTKLIAITGTNGKTTVATKTYELLKKAGINVGLAGNVGNSLAQVINDDYEYIVIELSSYQLENNPKIKPFIALITNLTPDHLKRYKDCDDYYNTKLNIFKNQDKFDYAIINKNDKEFNRLFKGTKSKIVYMNDYDEYIDFTPTLKGEHNKQNIQNIIAIAKILNISDEIIKEFFKTTNTLEHRMEIFYKKNNTVFVNDSKGTNVESTLFAVDAYKNSDLYLIAGGQDKKIDNQKLYDKIIENNIFVFLIGENANQYEKEFELRKYNKYINLNTIDKVVEYIKKNFDFNKNQIVLLSPATASFDQFENFEKRGVYFKEIVKKELEDK